MIETREALFRWMTGVLRERGWSAAAWARRAEVTPSNLTRFLKDPRAASLPGAETIGRLARAAGSEPRFLSESRGGGVWRVPVLTAEQIRLSLLLSPGQAATVVETALRGNGATVVLDRPCTPRAFAAQITSMHFAAGGILPGDHVVVEPPDVMPPRRGDLTVVAEDAFVGVLRFFPPLLVPASTDPASAPLPLANAALAGIAVHLVRGLRD